MSHELIHVHSLKETRGWFFRKKLSCNSQPAERQPIETYFFSLGCANMSENHLTRQEDWTAWRKACAARLCEPDIEAALLRFGTLRAQTLLSRWQAARSPVGDAAPATDPNDGWHLLETHARTGSTRAGKSYKRWLFARAEPAPSWIEAVEAGATLLLRAALREHLRREAPPAFTVSLYTSPGGPGERTMTWEELLPDETTPLDHIAAREWHTLARSHAEHLYPALKPREHLALWARQQGLTLSDRRLTRWSRTTPNRLYEVHREALNRLCHHLRSHHPDESPAHLVHLTQLVLQEMAERFAATIASHKRSPLHLHPA
jgi:hypothetical protein